jgi:hypothetical protein
MSDELRVIVDENDLCHVVDKATFDRMTAPIVEKAEQQAPPNPFLMALFHLRMAESILIKLSQASFQTRK